MVTKIRRERLMIPVAPAIAAMIGALVAGAIALMPTPLFETIVLDSGLPAILAVAAPPLGFTARLVLILVAGGGMALITWVALFLLLGARTLAVAPTGALFEGQDEVWLPILRRADAHPDAPARRPVFANRDLGTPFLEVRAKEQAAADAPALTDGDLGALVPEAMAAAAAMPTMPDAAGDDEMADALSIPADLDTPMAAYDPIAVPDKPIAVDRPTPPTRRMPALAPGERLETFALRPTTPAMPRDAMPAPVPRAYRHPAQTAESIAALLDRLERGVTHKGGHPLPAANSEAHVRHALDTLRQIAARG